MQSASWYHHQNIKIRKVCNENLVVDEYQSLIARQMYNVICERYNDLLDGHDNVSTYVHVLFSHQKISTE